MCVSLGDGEKIRTTRNNQAALHVCLFELFIYLLVFKEKKSVLYLFLGRKVGRNREADRTGRCRAFRCALPTLSERKRMKMTSRPTWLHLVFNAR